MAVLQTDYSKEADRKRKVGQLTAKEKAQQKDLLTKIARLQAKAKKDEALQP